MEHEPTQVGEVGPPPTNQLGCGYDGGIAPEWKCHDVIDAIRARRLWILTHPETRRGRWNGIQRAV